MAKTLTTTKGIFLFSSTIIGAGILALPVAAARAGFLPLAAQIVLMGIVSALSGLYIAEVALASPEPMQLPELAKKHLGRWGGIAMFLGALIYIYGALIGYLAAGGQIFSTLSKGAIPLWLGTLVYFAIGSAILHFGIVLVSRINTYLMYAMLVLLGGLIAIAAPKIQVPFLLRSDWMGARELFGIVLFAYLGHSVLPSIAFGLEQRRRIVPVVAWGIALPALLYLLWSLASMGVIPATSGDGHSLADAQAAGLPATIPLGFIIGGSVILLGNVFAAFSTMTSFMGFGISLRDTFEDLVRQRRRAVSALALTGLVVVPPLVVSLLNPGAFVKVLDISGMFGGGLFVGILPALMVLKLRKSGVSQEFQTWGGSVLPWLVLAVYAWGMYRTIEKMLN